MSNKGESFAPNGLLRGAGRRSEPGHSAESKLDALLASHERRRHDGESKELDPPETANPLDRLRRLFELELVPAFEQLREKYEARGIELRLHAENFLRGGRDIKFTIKFAGVGVRFDGTVMPNCIAFYQTRYNADDHAGLTASGPTLRTRNLDAGAFRSFVCDRITGLVQAVLQQKS